MVVCDYCNEQVTEGVVPVDAAVNPMQVEGSVHLDLHPECVKPWAVEVKKIKGQKPPKP